MQGAAPALMAAQAVAKVFGLEAQLALLPQVAIVTRHVIHAGMYARTITIPAGAALTGALIKRATLLVISGHVRLYGGVLADEVKGRNVVLPASAGRKTAWYAHEDTEVTMLFPTNATTVEDAEREFTDETDSLMSHREANHVVITGE
jgi:hypothetical protein